VAVSISFVGVMFAMLLTMLDIVLRFCFNCPLLGTYEIIEIVLACIVFSSFAYTQTQKGHIQVVMILRLLPQKLRLILYAFTSVLSSFIAAATAYAAYLQALHAIKKNLITASLYIPLFPFYYVEMVGMGIFALVLIFDAVKNIIAIFNAEYAREIQSEWI
jgi:TRAP-type C4-dicarboxylate transport system permease small subunit